MAEFTLNVRDIAEEEKTVRLSIPRAWLEQVLLDTDIEPGPVHAEDSWVVELHLHRSGADIIIRGRANATLAAPCVRCAEPVTMTVAPSIRALMTERVAQRRASPSEVDLTPEEIEREYFTGPLLRLDDVIRDHLLLEMPMQPRCEVADGECAALGVEKPRVGGSVDQIGAGPTDSQPTNGSTAIDPRLAPLLELRGRLGGKKGQ